MVRDLNISLDVFESRYIPLFKRFSKLDSSNNITRKYDLIEKYKFSCVYDVYRELTTRSSRVSDIILSGSDIDDFCNMVYEIKYYNNIIPSINKNRFFERERDFKSNDKILNFIDGYEKFYNDRKQNEKLVNEEKTKVCKFDKVDLYVSYIRNFIDGGYDKLDIFFNDFSIDKNDFYEGLDFLKEVNHPIFEEYSIYIDGVRSRRFSLLMKKARIIINGIKNGIKLEDGSVRKFDLIDYYSYTHMDISDFLRIISTNVKRSDDNKSFSTSDYRLVASFLGKYKDCHPVTEKGLQILFDNKNIYAIDSDNTYEATIEDKNNVLLILRERGIPVTSITFSIMLRRYVFDNYSNGKTKKIG
jgi:hypothetical protein